MLLKHISIFNNRFLWKSSFFSILVYLESFWKVRSLLLFELILLEGLASDGCDSICLFHIDTCKFSAVCKCTFSIFFTLLPIVIFFRYLQPLNAFLPILSYFIGNAIDLHCFAMVTEVTFCLFASDSNNSCCFSLYPEHGKSHSCLLSEQRSVFPV